MNKIPLSSVCLSELERRYVLEALDEGMISSSGPHVKRFEDLICRRVGVEHAIATASGTSALELLLRAMDIGLKDEVIVPALTFASPGLAVALVGATPVFADVTSETWTLDPGKVAELLTARTRAIIAVDVLGHPCDYDKLENLGVPIIEDAAEAHGATYKGRPAGSCGIASIFSFHANKTITSGEGGCVLTNDKHLAARVRKLNSFGMDVDCRYWHTEIGSNHRMANLVAAVALGQLERWDDLVAARRRVAESYDCALQSLPLQRRPVAEWAGESVWLYTVATERRASVLASCSRNGVDARPLWPSLPKNPVFAEFVRAECPRAEAISSSALWLPTWSGMPQESIDAVASAVAGAFAVEIGNKTSDNQDTDEMKL
jgi:perosamine synthetase